MSDDRGATAYANAAGPIRPARADDGIRIGCEDRHRQANHEERDRIFYFASPKSVGEGA
jgi:hypothetical protein